ncbi:Electron transport complex protein RnfA [uncultured Eubacteriales bacterium]|uniref:Electron transport complex protein RnfA n=1 Tax=uncultured Eubacteriales bacterium TaxID=172733 RepID=A0A212J330_9FIRM|nr:Electron transport complex protein RnfA [uncultured Eubacteriales bacterium]
MKMTELVALALAAIVVENFVLIKWLDIPPFLGGEKRRGAILGQGLLVTLALGLGSALTWVVDVALLTPLGLMYLRPAVCLLLVAGLVYGAGPLVRGRLPERWAELGVYLPLAAANGAALGAALWSMGTAFSFGTAAAYGMLAGVGFTAALALFSSVWERLEFSRPPRSFEGFPIALVAAGLLVLALLGFTGVRVW